MTLLRCARSERGLDKVNAEPFPRLEDSKTRWRRLTVSGWRFKRDVGELFHSLGSSYLE